MRVSPCRRCRPRISRISAVGEIGHEFEIAASDLKRLIDKTRFAISTEETRYYLNGIYLHTAQSGGKPMLRAVATDGHRLAQVELPLPKGAEGMPGVIIPRKTVHELHRLIEDSAASVKVASAPPRCASRSARVTLTSKLIDGTFPDYGRVIPQNNDKEMKVPNAEFIAPSTACRRSPARRGRAVKLNIEPGQADPVGEQPGRRQRHRGDRRRLRRHAARDRLQRSLSPRYRWPARGRRGAFLLADPGSPTMVSDGGDGARSTC